MLRAKRYPRFPLSGALLVIALSLLDIGTTLAYARLSPLRAGFALVLASLAVGAWLIARSRPRGGAALILCGAALTLALLAANGLSDPLMPLLCAAALVIPAGLCACLPAPAALRAAARGMAFASVLTGLMFLLQALATATTASAGLPFDVAHALALACTGWLFLSLDEGWSRRAALTAAAALSGVGWTGVLGWLIHAAPLVQGGTPTVPIAFNTALAFVLLGHALWLLAVGRPLSAWGLGLLCTPLALSPLLAEYTGHSDMLGELLWRQHAIRAEQALPGRLAPNTSLALLAAVLGLTAAALAKRHAGWWSAAWTSGLLVSLVATMALIGYLFALPGMRALGTHTPMSLPTAIGLLILGIGLVAGSSRAPSEHQYRTVVLPIGMCLLTVTLSLLLWLSLEHQQARLEWDAAQSRRDLVVNAVRVGMETQMQAVERLAHRLAKVPAATHSQLFAVDSQQYLHDMRSLYELGRADARRVLLQVQAGPASPIGAGTVLDGTPERRRIFDQVDAGGQPVLSAPLTLFNGHPGQLIVAPIRDGDDIRGYVIGALDFEYLFPHLLSAIPVLNNLRISQGGQVLFAHGSQPAGVTPVSADLALYSQWWRVDTYPEPDAGFARIPQLVLLLGFILGGLLALALRLSALARERASQAEAGNARLREQGHALERALEATRLMMDSAPDVICVLDRDGRFLQVSAAAQRMWGHAPETLIGERIDRVTHPEDHEATRLAAAAVMQGRPDPNFRNRNLTRDGRVLYMQWSQIWSAQSQCMYMVGRDHTDLHRAEDLEARQRKILTAIARGRALPQVLESIVGAYETQHDEALCSILLLRDGHLHHGAAPRLPAAFCRSIDGAAIGPEAGSCGTAAWRRERVVVADIASDPLWQNYAHLALPHGLQACWSTPVLARDGSVLGTFAVYYTEPRTPTPAQMAGIDTLAALAGVAIEREQAFQRLSVSEQRFRSLFEHHPDGVFALGPHGRVMQGNPAGAALLGIEPAQLRGHVFASSFTPAEVAHVRDLLASASQGESTRLDVTARDAHGNDFPAHLVNIPIIVEGEAHGVFAVLQDHRELHQAQLATASQLALIYAIAESVGEGLIAVDARGQPTFLNRAASRLLGLPADDLPGQAELPVAMAAPLQSILDGVNHVSDDNARFTLAGGQTLDVAYLATPLAIRGQLAGAVMAFRDIAGLKAARRILQQRNHFFEMSQEVFCIADPATGRFLQVNPAYARLLGFDEAAMLAIPFLDLLHPLDKAPTQEAIQRQMDEVEPINGLLTRMRCADGSYRWLEWVSISAADGLLYGAARDVTARHQADLALAKAIDDLRIRNRELQDFAYVASHDLQEPLRKIQSFSDRLQSRLAGELDDSARDYLQRMNHAAHRMQALIDDLLAYSRVATRTAAAGAVDLSAVLAAVLDDLEARIGEAHATIEIGPLPTIQADATQMRQLLQNLVANALKFRDADRPCRVSVRAADTATATGDMWELRVEDNGIGFEANYAERIFAPFQRLHPRNVYEGTGIGLAIVRRIVERHGGTVRAEARAGQGASFIVTLPLLPNAKTGSEAPFTDTPFQGADS